MSAALIATRLRLRLLRWFDAERRDLPWRRDHDPYRVWVSEIMLQQTRVAAVLGHYDRFMRRFPNVHALARARTSSVLAAWSGFGYYRRARTMHEAARQISRDGFPVSAVEWKALPGVGRYTAAAIASICHGEGCAVVDGNVKRVLARLLGRPPRDMWATANELLSPRRPGDFNQAMMELGATVCTPRTPACNRCPVAAVCRSCTSEGAANAGDQNKSSPQRRNKSHVAYALFRERDRVFLVQRDSKASVMPGLWELPSLPANVLHSPKAVALRHAIMNTDYRVTVVPMPVKGAASLPGRWFSTKRAVALPLTGLARKILRRFGMIERQSS